MKKDIAKCYKYMTTEKNCARTLNRNGLRLSNIIESLCMLEFEFAIFLTSQLMSKHFVRATKLMKAEKQ